MDPEPHFSEREIREVFERAAAEQERAQRRAASEGLTLSEMMDVGESAGITREFVAVAARAVKLGEPESGREALGPVPTGVSHTALLAEPPSDNLWETLVADARRTFGARGKMETVGRLREWRNGNLRLTLEPSGEGSRFHLRTRRSDAAFLVQFGAAFALIGLVYTLLNLVSGAPLGSDAWRPALVMLALGGAMGGGTLVRQRSWAATRADQMRALAERAAARSAEASALPLRPRGRAQEASRALEASRAEPLLRLDPSPEAEVQSASLAIARRRGRA